MSGMPPLHSFHFRVSRWTCIAIAFAGAPLLLCNSAPSAFAATQLVTYFNFNDNNETSDAPGVQTTTITQSNLGASFVTGTTLNRVGSDPAGSALRLTYSNNGSNAKTFQFAVSTVNLTNLSLSYATRTNVAGITQTLSYSTDNGTTFSSVGITPSSTFTPTTTFTTATFNLSTAVDNQASVIFRITLNPSDKHINDFNEFDNIQLNGTVVPEPATTAAGALALLGLCWHQRRRMTGVRRLLSRFAD